MWDMATPIFVGTNKVGNLYLGQFLFQDELPDIKLFRVQAQNHGFDEKEYIEAFLRVPRWSRETVNNVMGFYTKLAHFISDLGYRNVLLLKSEEKFVSYLNLVRKNPDRFDLVITDMAMPNMPGNKLSVELTKIRPDIPVLLCTGFSEAMSEETALSSGIKGFLLKPIIMKDLAQKIREVLDENLQ